MSLHTLPIEQADTEPSVEETVATLAHVAHGRYRSICEETSGELLSVTTPERLIEVLVLLRRKLKVRLEFIPTPPPTEALRSRRQTCEGRIRKINEEIALVQRTFGLGSEEVK